LVEWRKLDHSIVVAAISQWRRRLSACVRAHGGHFEHVLWHLHGSVCLQFHCFVYRQNLTCLKRFTRYWHYAGKVEDRRHNHRQTPTADVSEIDVPKLERLVAV